MLPLMNDTKWDELRLAMYELGPLSPKWRTLDVENVYLSDWDGEWFYHFRNGSYEFIKWVEIAVESPEQKQAVLTELVKIHVPGIRTESGFRVLGYAELGNEVDYISLDA
jgi:hypothetical protein